MPIETDLYMISRVYRRKRWREAIAVSEEFDAALVILSLVGPGRIATVRELLAPVLKGGLLPIIFHSPGIPSADNVEQLRSLDALQMSLRDAGVALRTLHLHGSFQLRRTTSLPEVSRSSALSGSIASDFVSDDRQGLRGIYRLA